MIILNDDRAYLAWIAHHRAGFVLDARRKPSARHQVLHRALCPEIKAHAGKRARWTTGAKLKACSLAAEELCDWAVQTAGKLPTDCPRCRPRADLGPQAVEALVEPDRRPGLSRQALRILDQVLEVAVIALEQAAPYALTLDELAATAGKRPGQLAAGLLRLLADGYLTSDLPLVPGAGLPATATLRPTAKALRTLPAFAGSPAAEIEGLLKRLQ